jgi:hypothetical protein
MPALADSDRRTICEKVHDTTRDPTLAQTTLAELLPLIAAIDDWVVANAAAYNAALPQPFRSALTAPEKARLLTEVIKWRWFIGA